MRLWNVFFFIGLMVVVPASPPRAGVFVRWFRGVLFLFLWCPSGMFGWFAPASRCRAVFLERNFVTRTCSNLKFWPR